MMSLKEKLRLTPRLILSSRDSSKPSDLLKFVSRNLLANEIDEKPFKKLFSDKKLTDKSLMKKGF